MSAFENSDVFDAFEEDDLESETVNKRKGDELLEHTQNKKKKLASNYKDGGDSLNIVDELDDLQSINKDVPQFKCKQLTPLISNCTHEVVYMESQEEPVLRPRQGKPAKEYKFTLDGFQEQSVSCIDNNQSVLVSAHTSAGKTSVAEYAIAVSLNKKQRVIYTSPIKALSNQKYRDLKEEFDDVGLMTGDVTIDQNASCLVMTTEILRSMLYKGSEIMREVGWVVFDEIHYMRNKERGVVWEETIILLPDNVRYVFLSATIPNAKQLAEWVCYLHHQPVHVVYTSTRPVPLEHYIFPMGGQGLHMVVDRKGVFNEENFNSAMTVIREGNDQQNKSQGRRNGGKAVKAQSACEQIIELIKRKKYLPAIVFSFSKKECEFYAKSVAKIRFNQPEEEALVEEIFNAAMKQLSAEDRCLPQVERTVSLLKRGIGIHHGGLLPIIKETTEILFGEGLIKILFATETFAMGVNMPAHTVVFTSVRKFDGQDFRTVTGGEYIQMSGRAGRRGKDENGIVIMMVDEKLSPSVGKSLVKGSSDPIDSAFRLTYNMVLNLLRVEEINPEYMLEKSFYQFQHYQQLPKAIENMKDLQKKHDDISIEDEDSTKDYYKIRLQIHKLGCKMKDLYLKPKYTRPFLQPGRMVTVNSGVMGRKGGGRGKEEESQIVVDVLLNCDKDTIRPYTHSGCTPRPAHTSSKPDNSELSVIPVILSLIRSLSPVRLPLPSDLNLQNRKAIMNNIEKVKQKMTRIPELDPIEDLRVRDPKLLKIIEKIEAFEKRMFSHPLHISDDLEKRMKLYDKKSNLWADVKVAKKELKQKKKILQFEELKSRKRVLRRLEYSTCSDVIETKGRVACEISAADEILLTELIFDGIFNDLTPEQCCALLSCFVFDEKSKSAPKLSEVLADPLRKLQQTAKKIAKISVESKLDMDTEKYVDSFKTNLMDAVYAWASKKSFAEVLECSETYEGSIIRCMRRLEELLREMANAAKTMGNPHLENKFTKSIELIKRDIVFAASLYL